jgi:No apical meristem (NAM) protein
MENLSELMENLSELSTIWPGMRFQPTERELIECYLKRKLREEDFHDEVFSEIDDFYKYTPWELAGLCIFLYQV